MNVALTTRKNSMKTINHLNTVVSDIDLNDAIYSKIQKSKAILTSVMFANELVQNDTVYNALWAVDDYLEEIEVLMQQVSKKIYTHYN